MKVNSLPFPRDLQGLASLRDFAVFSENFQVPDKILSAKEGIFMLN